IDVGTTRAKGMAFDLAGKVVASGSAGYPTRHPCLGRVEQDPEDWWRAVLDVLRQLGSQAALRRVRAVGVCSQVNTHAFVDVAGTPLIPAITWQDQRCAAVAAELDASIDPQRREALWGGPFTVDASFPLVRIAWLKRARRGLEPRWMLLPKDYVNLRLCGAVASDPISAIGLVDADAGYSSAVIALVPGAAELLPPLRDPDEVLGQVTSRESGLPPDAVVVASTMDGWANRYGSGALDAGDGFEVAGTSEIVGVVSARNVPTAGVITFPRREGLWLHAGPTQAGGDALRWYAEARGTDIDAVLGEAARAAPGSDRLLFLPHLMGERAPLWDSNARGVFFGLSLDHGAPQLARSVLEGVAYSARQLLGACEDAAGLRTERLALSGGAARSDLWCQIKADVLDRELVRLRVLDSGVLGAALFAGAGAGLMADVHEAARRMIHPERAFTPKPGVRRMYDDLYGIYCDLYERLAPSFAALGAIDTQSAP
ncbi:MAG TPA: FGGY-family carbohydrate kinase, partial [Nevskiaceae bacterium]